MKSPPEPESTNALAGISLFPTRSETDKMSLESEEEEPVNVIAETGNESGVSEGTTGFTDKDDTDAFGGGVGGSSVTCGSTGAGVV